MRVFASVALGLLLFMASPALSRGALIAYYTFDDPANGGAASAGTAATLRDNASITQTISDIAVGTGALELTTPQTEVANGAISGNDFDWTNDTRSVAFWMKAGTQSDSNPTMISLGSGAGAGTGTRFDIRLSGSELRLELQGGGSTISGTNLTDDNWYLVGVVVPTSPATLASTSYYIYDSSATQVATGTFSGSTAINTGTGPLRIGDSYQDTGRDFVGFLDEVRVYDSALTEPEVQALAAQFNPVPEPGLAASATACIAVGGLAFHRLRRRAT